MSTFDYSEFLDFTNEMFDEYGHTDVPYTAAVPGDYDPSTRSVNLTETTTLINPVILPTVTNSDRKNFDSQFSKAGYSITGLVIGDARTMFIAGDALATAPKPGDRCTFESKTWLVRGYTTINPGGTVILWKVGVFL